MLPDCERFELHTFSSFAEIKTNSLLPRITDQQLRQFRHQWGIYIYITMVMANFGHIYDQSLP